MNEDLVAVAETQVQALAALPETTFEGMPYEDARFIRYMKTLSDEGGLLSYEQLFKLQQLHEKYCVKK